VMKRRFWFVLVMPLALTFCSPAEPVVGEGSAASEQPVQKQPQLPEGLFNSYVASQKALAVDSYEDARAALEQLAADSSGELQTLAQAAVAAENIEGIRAAFVPISDEVAKATLPEGYSLAFCPMANNFQGANWVQEGEDINNPYFGASMLTCGEIVQQ
jgi:Cu(I)/Ag(I) efflux system membrane fusion protein